MHSNNVSTLIKRLAMTAAALALAQPAWAQTSSLYGWTYRPDAGGNVDFVSISDVDGHASFQFSIAVPTGYEARDLTYDPTAGGGAGRFFGLLRGSANSLLAEIDPMAQTMITHSISGLPNPGLEGIEFLKGTGLVMSGADVTGTINALFVVNHSGTVLQTGLVPGLQDQDSLYANSLGGNLHVSDVNHPTGGYYLNEWHDPFGTPILTGVYHGPRTGSELDVAIDPYSNIVYTSQRGRLARYDMGIQQQFVVGDFNYATIWGIATVPAPGSIVLGAVACSMIGLRRRGHARSV
ncbi:MAG: hypothetical protein AABZ53_07180 [Planctomycetota bacterium]